MIPQNESEVPVRQTQKQLSWMDRMQQAIYEADGGRKTSEVLQETGAFFETQFITFGTNVRKFCAEFVEELLLPPDSSDKCERPRAPTPQAELTSNCVKRTEKPSLKVEASSHGVDGPTVGSTEELHSVISQTYRETEMEVEALAESSTDATVPTVMTHPQEVSSLGEQHPQTEELKLELSQSDLQEGEQYAHWFVTEEYRTGRLGKVPSAASVQSLDGHQRVGSSDSLLDWELV